MKNVKTQFQKHTSQVALWTLSKVKTSLTVVGYPNLVVIKHNGSTFYHSFENDSFGRPIYIEKSKVKTSLSEGS